MAKQLTIEVAVSFDGLRPRYFNVRAEDETTAGEAVKAFAERVALAIRDRISSHTASPGQARHAMTHPTPAEIEEAVRLAPTVADEREVCSARGCSGGILKWGGPCGACEDGYVGPTPAAKLARALLAVVEERDELRAPVPRDNAGWRRKLLMWHWHDVSLAGYPGWDLEGPKPELQPGERDRRNPPFVKLTHVHGKGRSSSDLANAWDNIAVGRFYQRDWTESGIPFVNDGETYWSGWWFEYAADRDRFVAWEGASDADE